MAEGMLRLMTVEEMREWYVKLAPFSQDNDVICENRQRGMACHRIKHAGTQHAYLNRFESKDRPGEVHTIWFE